MIRFIALFIVLLVGLFTIELLEPVQRHVVLPWTTALAHISGWLIRLFDPEVIAQGKVLWRSTTGAGVSIEAGCNGVEACIMLIAAVLSFPSGVLMKVAGIVIGIVAVQSVNVLRVITLFYLVEWNYAWFEFAHLYLWQALIMFDVLIVWLVWVRAAVRSEARRDAPV